MPFGVVSVADFRNIKTGTTKVTPTQTTDKVESKSDLPRIEDYNRYTLHGQRALDIDGAEIRHDLIKKMILKDPILVRSILMQINHILGGGYIIKKVKDSSTADLHKLAFTNWLEGKHITNINQREPIMWTLETAIWQYINHGQIFLYVLPDRLGFPVKLIVLDVEDIRVNYDEHGNLIDRYENGKLVKGAYTQVVDEQEVAQFTADEIIHIRFNRLANRMHGMPITQSMLEVGATKRLAFLFNAKYFENHKPRGLWDLGEVPPSVHQAFEELLLNNADVPQVDFVVSGKGQKKYQPLATNEEMQFAELYRQVIGENVFGMGIPPEKVLMGGNRAVLDAKNEDYERMIQKLQQDINIMMTEVAKKFGWYDIEFMLRPISKADEVRQTQMAVQKWTVDGITLNQFLSELNYDLVESDIGDLRRTELLHKFGGQVKGDLNLPQIANNPNNLPEVNPNIRENKALKERKK